jgi:hypothetical protein
MRPEDRNEFLGFVQKHDPVSIVLRDEHSPSVEQAADLNVDEGKTLCLWNRKILPRIDRKWIPEPGYYRVDSLKSPVLEFTPSFTATWEGKPALGQGRLFGNFEPSLGKPPEFEKWYGHLTRWIRKNYRKSPTSLGGYIGPAAYEFYNEGGYLLPNFLPPRTKEWLSEIGKQGAQPKTPLRTPKHPKTRIDTQR